MYILYYSSADVSLKTYFLMSIYLKYAYIIVLENFTFIIIKES